MLTKEAEQIMISKIPEPVKDAIQNFEMHKLAENALGVREMDFQKAASILAHSMMERRARWKGIGDGLTALKQLSEG